MKHRCTEWTVIFSCRSFGFLNEVFGDNSWMQIFMTCMTWHDRWHLDLMQCLIWSSGLQRVILWRLVANRDIRAPSSPITNCSCWPCRMPRHVPVRDLILSRDRFGRTSTAEVFEDAANHHNTHTHTEKKTIYIKTSRRVFLAFFVGSWNINEYQTYYNLASKAMTVLYCMYFHVFLLAKMTPELPFYNDGFHLGLYLFLSVS